MYDLSYFTMVAIVEPPSPWNPKHGTKVEISQQRGQFSGLHGGFGGFKDVFVLLETISQMIAQ